jgi:hypothetical protein
MIIRVSNHADRIRLIAIQYEGRFRKRKRPSPLYECRVEMRSGDITFLPLKLEKNIGRE